MSSIFSILIATDCHLGYEETDHIIGEDSFVTFEEILIRAVEEEVDLILLGGDLFHHNNPSQKCMHKCMELLRRYTLGDRPVYFELLCNAAEVFSNSVFQTTNYLDDNINVSIPVFSIHGNHDDPSGIAQSCALDTLSSAGLINYFGKWTDLQEVVIKPILMRKGKTKIALYGLSHIKDDRLCRLFVDGKVKFVRPNNEPNEWFNIFVLHQNRADRGPKRFISESHLPDFIDLVVWGHEHDCEIEPVQSIEKGFYVIQPGSSVPTSLCEGESLEKHVAVLKVYERKMKLKPIKLNTTRPFVWRSINLWDIDVTAGDDERDKKSEEIKTHCRLIVEEMLVDAKKLLTGHVKQPKLPLVRLRCVYDHESQLFNAVKFGQAFDGRVANPYGDIVRLKRSFAKGGIKKETSEDLARLKELYKQEMADVGSFTACVSHIIMDYFTNHEESKMLLLRVGEMGAAVEKFIDKDDPFAVDDLVDARFEAILKELNEQKVNVDETDLKDLFERLRKEEEKTELKSERDLQKKLEVIKKKQRTENISGRSGTDSDDRDLSPSKFDSEPKSDFSDDGHSALFTSDKKKRLEKKSPAKDNKTAKPQRRGRGKTSEAVSGEKVRTKRETVGRKTSKASPLNVRGGRMSKQPSVFQNAIIYDSDSE